MKRSKEKKPSQFYSRLRLIFLPFVLINVSIICIYTFLNWLLVIKLDLFKADETITNLGIPMGLPWIPLFIWLRPRLKFLNINASGSKNPITGLIYISGIAIIPSLVLSQFYMTTATGKLTRLDYMSKINYAPFTKYYMVDHFYVAKNMVHLKIVFTVSGKHNTGFNMSIYAAVPVFDHLFPDTNVITLMRNSLNTKGLVIINGKLSNLQQLKKLPADSIRRMRYLNPSLVMPKYGDTGKFGALLVLTYAFKLQSESPPPKIDPAAWLAVKFTKTINNNLTAAEKEARFSAFARQCEYDFKHRQIDKFVYLNRTLHNSEQRYYLDAIKLKGDVVDGFPIVLSPVYESYANRNGNTLAWFFGSFAIGAGVFLLIICFFDLRDGVT